VAEGWSESEHEVKLFLIKPARKREQAMNKIIVLGPLALGVPREVGKRTLAKSRPCPARIAAAQAQFTLSAKSGGTGQAIRPTYCPLNNVILGSLQSRCIRMSLEHPLKRMV